MKARPCSLQGLDFIALCTLIYCISRRLFFLVIQHKAINSHLKAKLSIEGFSYIKTNLFCCLLLFVCCFILIDKDATLKAEIPASTFILAKLPLISGKTVFLADKAMPCCPRVKLVGRVALLEHHRYGVCTENCCNQECSPYWHVPLT